MRLQAMAAAAPQQLQQATRQPVEKLLSGNQAEDKARTCAAIELLCGLIASGQIFGPDGEAFQLRIGSMPSSARVLKKQLQAAPEATPAIVRAEQEHHAVRLRCASV